MVWQSMEMTISTLLIEDMNIIFKSDKLMKKVSQKKTEEKKVRGHWCVAVVRDEVMVCERGNRRYY